jgi:hypothetical protein
MIHPEHDLLVDCYSMLAKIEHYHYHDHHFDHHYLRLVLDSDHRDAVVEIYLDVVL